jgi:hypothetical protein
LDIFIYLRKESTKIGWIKYRKKDVIEQRILPVSAIA